MADDTPKRKQYDSANWEVVARENARAREAARQRGKIFEALNKFITAEGGWITSLPGRREIRIEIRKNSALPRNYTPRLCSTGTRITGGNFAPVDVIEISLGK